ncbi:MAG: 23S rRNA (uracil(1939)-C(5))-methyltransferase RlmD [Lachnospiraceae bacterium]|nr:23S rRNA (uracil(1939)-C(5))-methyltransferase RlmD [Lachnospiraceae bacterium]
MDKNDIFEVTIEDMTCDGEGIGKVDGFPLFIKDAVIGDVIEAKVTKLKKTYGYARLNTIVKPSSLRVIPKCSLHKKCGGCQIQAMDYCAQLKFKQDLVINNLVRIGRFDEDVADVMEPIVGMDEPYRYRNKAQFPVGKKDGRVIMGFYAGRTHDIMECDDCVLGDENNALILNIIKAYMTKFNVPAYDEVSGKGLIRHVLIRKGFATNEWMVCLVIAGEKLPHSDVLVSMLRDAMPEIVSISISPNKRRDNVIMGDDFTVLYGEAYIHESLSGITYKISPLSFFQVNPIQTEKLYAKVVEYANLTGKENVWDLYCGTGSISLFLAGKAGKVHGVEIVPQAIDDARENAKTNSIENAEFFVGKAEDVFTEQVLTEGSANYGEKIDVVVVDPPRKGCDVKLLGTILKMAPSRIVYVSCDSATLARDLKILCETDYRIDKLQCFDQFPHTVHVETVCLLSKLKDAKQHVEIEVSPEVT